MNPKPILFIDFDGTLCFDKYWRSLPAVQYEQIQSFIFGEDKTLLNDWMRGVYTAEEINKMVAKKIEISFNKLWKLFVQDCETMQVSSNVLEKISALRDRYIVILITGNMDSFTRFTVPALHLDQYFDYINNSFFDHRLKDDKEGESFVEYSKALNVSLKNCILIDNSVKACHVFSALEGKSCLITEKKDIIYYLKRL